jgi:hypothetical protein
MGLKFIPKIVYNSTTLTLTWPQKFWSPKSKPIGGSAVSDAGVPESFIIRRDQLCKTTIRFTEAEWASVDSWLNWAQQANSFDYWFDKNLIGTKYTCYLEEPNLGDGEIDPDREEFGKIFVLPITLRTTNGTRFDVRIFS